MATDMEAHMKQKCVTEFLYVEKMAPTDIHGYLLNVSGYQTVNVGTVMLWVMHVVTATVVHFLPCRIY